MNQKLPPTLNTKGTMAKHLLIIFTALLLFSVLFPSFHYPVDMENQSNCAICKVAHDLHAGDTPSSLIIVPSLSIATVTYTFDIIGSISTISTFSSHNRAPPA